MQVWIVFSASVKVFDDDDDDDEICSGPSSNKSTTNFLYYFPKTKSEQLMCRRDLLYYFHFSPGPSFRARIFPFCCFPSHLVASFVPFHFSVQYFGKLFWLMNVLIRKLSQLREIFHFPLARFHREWKSFVCACVRTMNMISENRLKIEGNHDGCSQLLLLFLLLLMLYCSAIVFIRNEV